MKNIHSQTTDVVICGTGIAGISTAYYLTKAGVKDVILVDSYKPLSLTSDKSAECYRNWWPSKEMSEFVSRSIFLMEHLAHVSGNVFRMNHRGYAFVTLDDTTATNYERQLVDHNQFDIMPYKVYKSRFTGIGENSFEYGEKNGKGADLLLDSSLIRDNYSYLSKDVKAVLQIHQCGWLSAQQLGMYMLDQAKMGGVRFISGEVVKVEIDKSGVKSIIIKTNNTFLGIDTRLFVIAAGPYSQKVGNLLNIRLPTFNELHEKIVIKDSLGIIPRSAPMVILSDIQELEWLDEEKVFFHEDPNDRWLLNKFPSGVFFRPEGETESDSVLLGWAYHLDRVEPIVPIPLSQEFPDVVLLGATKIVPDLKRYRGKMVCQLHDGGYYHKTSDNKPLIGPLNIKGTYIVGALSGFGIMVGCAAGELTAAWVTKSSLPNYANSFHPDREIDDEFAHGQL